MDEIDTADPVAVRAIGGFATLLVSALHGKALLDMGEFSRVLAMYTTVTRDDDPEAGLMLAQWADQLQNAADEIRAATAH